MGKLAFIFPGQGSQYAGMGKEVYDRFACSRAAFSEADEALGFSLSGLCFDGPDDALKLTHNTQPAILTTSIAILRVLQEQGIRPDYVAGHSLGEYSGLVCAGALTLRNAVQIVRKRGSYMQEAVPVNTGAMAAVLGLEPALVAEACRETSAAGVVSPANYNAPEQTVIAGAVGAVQEASRRAKAKGAKRVVPLAVSAPFHCELIAPARERLWPELTTAGFEDLAIPLVTNVDAAEVRRGDYARDALFRQVCAPVRWVESIQYLWDCGVDRFVEVGPAKVLTALVKKITPGAAVFNVECIRDIEALASGLADATM